MATVLRKDTINYFDPATGNPMQKQVVVEVEEYKVVDETVKVGTSLPIVVQLGPTPGEAYAVFAKNKLFHEKAVDVWELAARQALEVWAARGNFTVTRVMNEHGRPLNLRMEYTT